MVAASFRALDTDVVIETTDATVADAVAVLTACYPRARETPSLRYRLDAASGVVQRDDETLRRGAAPAELAQLAASDMQEQVIQRAGDSFLAPAAALAGAKGAVLLVGAPGSGKTAMTRALLARGARYLTDEVAAVDAEHRVRGLPRPLELEGEDAPGLAPATGLGRVCELPSRAKRADKPMVLLPAPERVQHEPVPLEAIVLLQHAPREAPGLERVPKASALQALWRLSTRPDSGGLEIAIALAGRFDVHRLVTHAIDQACADLARIWSP